MKISSIPQLISTSSNLYMSLADLPRRLATFTSDYGLDLDPDFQRPQVWSNRLQQRFVEYLLRGGKVPPLLFNSPAYKEGRRSKSSDLEDTVILVDGKQRLTAILKFLDNKLSVFDNVLLSDFDKPLHLTRFVGLEYSVNSLQTRREVLQWYLELNEGHVAHSKEELRRVRRMLK